MKPRKTSYNNCLFWAVWRCHKKGGALLVRRAAVPLRWYPHYAYLPAKSSSPQIVGGIFATLKHWWINDGYLVFHKKHPIRWMPYGDEKIEQFVPVRNVIFPWPVFKGYVKYQEHRDLRRKTIKPTSK